MGFFYAAHSAGRTAWVKRAAKRVGLLVKLVVVRRLVYADSPQKNRRVVPVLLHHLADILDGLAEPQERGNNTSLLE